MTNNINPQTNHEKAQQESKQTLIKIPRNDTLKALRMARGWNITDLASKANMPRSRVSKIECFKLRPSIRDMIRLAKSLECDSRVIFPEKRQRRLWERLRQEAIAQASNKEEAQEPIADEKLMDEYY